MLAPSQHLFLLSAKSLETLARNAGFSWVKTWTRDERLFLAAGPKLQKISNHFPREDYIEYLSSKLLSKNIDENTRFRSFGYRLFKEYVNGGRYEEAYEIWSKLAVAYNSMHIDLESPIEVVKVYREASGAGKMLPAPKDYPFNIALIMFLKGILLIAFEHNRIVAKTYFEAAIKLCDLYGEVFSSGIFQTYDLELQNVGNWAREQISLHSL